MERSLAVVVAAGHSQVEAGAAGHSLVEAGAAGHSLAEVEVGVVEAGADHSLVGRAEHIRLVVVEEAGVAQQEEAGVARQEGRVVDLGTELVAHLVLLAQQRSRQIGVKLRKL